jgi:hypothetical protein
MTIKKAKAILFDKTPIEVIISSTQTKDYIQFVGKVGGDVLTYRIYNDGRISEK